MVAMASLTAADDKQPEDVVTLKNGDRITGKIKGMTQGQLALDTDHLGTLNIAWVHIQGIAGTEVFEVESEAGDTYVGSIRPSEQKGKILIVEGDKTTELDQAQVVRIVPIKKRFWGRIDGAVSLGYSYTKSSNVSQLSFNGAAAYRSQRHMTDLTLATSVTVQEVADTTSRVSLVGAHTRFLEHDWLAQTDATFGQNQELGFDAQVLLGGGGGDSSSGPTATGSRFSAD